MSTARIHLIILWVGGFATGAAFFIGAYGGALVPIVLCAVGFLLSAAAVRALFKIVL